MRILICDDDEIFCKYLDKLINEYALENNKEFFVTIYHSAEELLLMHNASFPFDLIFLDIEMKELDGISLAKKIRKIDKSIPLVFITGISDFVFEGYEVGAYRYLMKPLKCEKLHEILDYFYTNVPDIKYIIFNTKDETIKLNTKEIYYIEAMGHYLNINLRGKIYRIKESLTKFYSKLNDEGFLYIHRSFLVNLYHINAIKRDLIILDNKIELRLARGYYASVNEAFIKYYKEQI